MGVKKEFSFLKKDLQRQISPDASFVSTQREKIINTISLQRSATPVSVEKKRSAIFEAVFSGRLSFSAKPVMASVLAFLITGTGWIASVAAQGSTPDEIIPYFVKRTTERIHVAVVPTKRKSAVKMGQAAERSEEIKKLVEKKDPEVKAHIEKTLADLDTIVQDVARGIDAEPDKKKKRDDVRTMVDTMDVISVNLDGAKKETKGAGEGLDEMEQAIDQVSDKSEQTTTEAVKKIVKDVEEGGTEEEKEEVREIVREVVDQKIEKIEGSVEDLEGVTGDLQEEEGGEKRSSEEEIDKIIEETKEGVEGLSETTDKLLDEDKLGEAIDLVEKEGVEVENVVEETSETVEQIASEEERREESAEEEGGEDESVAEEGVSSGSEGDTTSRENNNESE